AIDSLELNLKERREGFIEQMRDKYAFQAYNNDSLGNKADKQTKVFDDNIIENIAPIERQRVVQNALRIARSNKAYFFNSAREFLWKSKTIARHKLEWQKKFSISLSCLVLFFIGAPLGAIIRKGGMGMPVVISV